MSYFFNRRAFLGQFGAVTAGLAAARNSSCEVYDLAGQPLDHQVLLVSLQGLVNRRGPRLYLLWPSPMEGLVAAPILHLSKEDVEWRNLVYRRMLERSGRPEERWLRYYGERLNLRAQRVDDWQTLITRYKHELRGCVIYDPALLDSISVALTMAGLENAVVASPSLAEALARLGIPVIADLRGRWSNKLAAHAWAVEQLWPRCSRRVIGCLDFRAWPILGRAEIGDYLVRARAFVHSLTTNPKYPDEVKLLSRLLGELPPLTLAMGWHAATDNEERYVQTLSKHGLNQVCCWVAPNFSFHAHLRSPSPLRQTLSRPARAVERKIYVTVSFSDGDSLWALSNGQMGQWDSSARGRFPVNWWMQPLLLDLAPAMLGYYFQTKTARDFLLMGPSGDGYVQPAMLPAEILKTYLQHTREYGMRSDLRAVHTGEILDARARAAYAAALGQRSGKAGFLGVLESYHAPRRPEEILERLRPRSAPVEKADLFPFVPLALHVGWKTDLAGLLRTLAERATARPLFASVLIQCWSRPLEEIAAQVAGLDPATFAVVRGDEFLSTARRWLETAGS